MSELYTQIKYLHILCIVCSGMLFTARGVLMWAGSAVAHARMLRGLSYVIDSVLLACGAALTSIIGQYPFVSPWLTAKLLLLVAYIVLGSVALRRGRTRLTRQTCFIAAVSVYLFIISVAVTHDPKGLFTFI